MQGHCQVANVGRGTQGSKGDTPLIEACRAGNLHQVKVLIQAGAEITAVDDVSFCM